MRPDGATCSDNKVEDAAEADWEAATPLAGRRETGQREESDDQRVI